MYLRDLELEVLIAFITDLEIMSAENAKVQQGRK